MQLTLTVSPEALEDLGSLGLLEPPWANIMSQDSCMQKHGARCPLHLPFTPGFSCSCSTWTLQEPHKKVQMSPLVGNQCSRP